MRGSPANLSVNAFQGLTALCVVWILTNAPVTHAKITGNARKDLRACFCVTVSLDLKDQHARVKLTTAHQGLVNIMVFVCKKNHPFTDANAYVDSQGGTVRRTSMNAHPFLVAMVAHVCRDHQASIRVSVQLDLLAHLVK